MRNIPWEHIDIEMRPLIKELNKTGCIKTIGCCIGHGLDPVGNVLFKIIDEATWKNLMMDLLKVSLDLKESNIEIFQWHRFDDEGNYLVDWKLDIEVHPRRINENELEQNRIGRVKQEAIQKIIMVINKR